MFKKIRKEDRKLKNNSKDFDIGPILSNDSQLVEKLEKNIAYFRQLVGLSHDVNIRFIQLAVGKGIDAAVIHVEGLTDKEMVNNAVIKALLVYAGSNNILKESSSLDLFNIISQKIISNVKLEQENAWTNILDKMFSGDTILFVDGLKSAFVIGTRKWVDRGVQEPVTEQVIRGPKDSFSETLVINTMLLRRRIKSYKLQMEYTKVGSLTKTDIIIAYVNGVVNPKLVEEVRKRISRIETDAIFESNMIEEFIEDNAYAILPQVGHTERPDKTAAHLVEGGVAVIIDGTPMVLLVPVTFWKFLYSPDDYYERAYTTFFLRSLRLLSLFLALGLPSFYIAVASFHHEMIPIGLLEVIISGRRNVPFPILVEVFIMELILEIIREAGVRLPRNVGQAISIVGALVLGQAAIQAKLASPATVTIVAITAVANFTIPVFSSALSVRILRFLLMIVSGVYGIFGFITAFFVLIIHLCSLRSFGTPFMAPLAPLIPADFKDSQIRFPVWAMSRRPKLLGAKDQVRQKAGLKPDNPQNIERPTGGKENE